MLYSVFDDEGLIEKNLTYEEAYGLYDGACKIVLQV